jgi:hypothetical protein
MAKRKKTKLQNTTYKSKDWATQPYYKIRGEFLFSW